MSLEVLGNVRANLSVAIEEAGALVTSDAMPVVMADAGQFGQLFQNLVGNGLKFRNGAQPHVHVRAVEANAALGVFRDVTMVSESSRSTSRRIFVIFQRLHTQGRLPGHRNRPRTVQAHRRAARRQNLGGVEAERRIDFLLHHSKTRAHGNDMTNAFEGRPVEILLIEDNAGDVRLAREGLRECKLLNNLSVAEDGVKALAFLRREGEHAKAPRPDLIMLDLNLPEKGWARGSQGDQGGRRAEEHSRRHPHHVAAEEDIVKSYSLHANCYVTKPLAIEQFINVVQAIESFWFTIVKLPPRT